MPDAPEPRPPLRASDADRERTAELLREAAGEGRLDVDELDERLTAAYAGRTRSELERLVADVVADDDAHQRPVATPRGRMPVRREGGPGTRNVVAVMGGSGRNGHWRLAEHVLVANVMGGADLDLNEAELSAPETRITVFSLMGGSELWLPDGLNVEVEDFALMGGNDVKLGERRPDPGGPVVRLRLVSIMGGTDVKRGTRRAWREARDERKRLKREARARRRLH